MKRIHVRPRPRARSARAALLPRRELRLETLESRHVLSALLFAGRYSAPEPAAGPPAPEPTHEIRGVAWNDTDGNQNYDLYEPLLADRTVYLDANRNGRLDLGETRTTTTADDPATTGVDEAGAFAFSGLPAGMYHVRQAPRAGWESVSAEPYVVSLGDGGIDYLHDTLDTHYAEIAAVIPNRFNFTGGESGTSIPDGGSDMYDGGNIIGTNLASAIGYTGGAIAAGDAQFGPGSRYFTAKYPGLFVLAAQNVTLDHFEISGATGTNGLGSYQYQTFDLAVNGRSFRVFQKQVYGAGDPSIIQLFIVPDHAPFSASAPNSTARDGFRVDGLTSVHEVYYLLASRRGGGYSEVWFDLATAFIEQVPRSGDEVTSLTFGGRALGKLDGFVWHDRNEDGHRDEFEPGLSNWLVYVDSNANGALDGDELQTTTLPDNPGTPNVNEAGYYSFSGFPPGSQSVRVEPQAGWVASVGGNARQVRMGSVDLDATLANLDHEHIAIAAAVPNRYGFHEGGAGDAIVDGGDNMYDTGNRLSTDRAATIPYTNHAVAAGDAMFGPGSRYFTTKYPGLFVAAAGNISIDRFEIAGRTGAAGGGRVVTTKLPLNFAGEAYTVFVKQIVEAATPSIIHVIVIPGDGTGVVHQTGQATDDDFDSLSGLSGVSDLYYMLASRHDHAVLADEDVLRMASAMLSSVAIGDLEVTAANLGYRGTYSLSGTKWHDLDGDGTRDAGEPGLAGWTIFLDENNDAYHGEGEVSRVTRDDDPATPADETGAYSFEHLPPGTQHVREVRQPGWQPSVADDGHTILMGGLNLSRLLGNLDAGNASITALVPNRFDFTEGETGERIIDGGGNMYDNGNVLYSNTWGNVNYSNRAVSTVPVFGPQSQYFTAKYPGLFVLAASGTSNDFFQVAGNLGAGGNGQADIARFTTTVGGQTYTILVKRVYNDPATPSVNHIVIVPGTDPNLNHDYSGFTGSDYHPIYGLSTARQFYYLLVSRQAGGFLNDGQMQAIANQFLSFVPSVTNDEAGLDFGNVRVGEITGAVWRDRDRDGGRDSNEIGVANATIYLDANNNGELDAGELATQTIADIAATTETDETGNYTLLGAPTGIHVMRQVVPVGWSQTLPADVHTVKLTVDQAVPGGNIAQGIHFAASPNGRVEGLKWNDLDLDSTRDANEPGLSGWTIFVDENFDGVLQPTEPSTVTAGDDPATPGVDETGQYVISDVPLGQLRIREVAQNGWERTFPFPEHQVFLGDHDLGELLANLDAGNGSVAGLVPNRFDFSGGEVGNFIEDGGGNMYEFGNWLYSSSWGGVPYSNRAVVTGPYFGQNSQYFTAKYPGLFVMGVSDMSIHSFETQGNLGAAGQGQAEISQFTTTATGQPYTVFLKRVHGAPTPSVNHLYIVPGDGANVFQDYSTYTGSDYHRIYNLGNVRELYYLVVSRQAGARLEDADARNIAEAFLELLPPPSQLATGLNFGNRLAAAGGEIHGVVWHDSNHNGVRESHEVLVPNWTVYLDADADGQLDENEPRVVTPADDPATPGINETGVYSFTGLATGTYHVAQVAQDNWMPTFPPLAPNGRHEFEINLPPGVVHGNLSFGNRLPAGDIEIRGGPGQTPIQDGDTTPEFINGTVFAPVELGGDFREQTFTIVNTGELPLLLTGTPLVRVTGPNAADFTITAEPPLSTLNAGALARFTLRFVPGAAGARTATIEIASDDFDEALYDFVVSGTGTIPNIRAVDDAFTGAIEDTPFTTAGGGSTIIPLQATGWDIHEGMLRSVNQYPTDAGGRDWKDLDYEVASSRIADTASPWRTGLRAPFEFGQIDAFDNIATTAINVPANTETTFVARRTFTLDAVQASAESGTITYTCDSGCAFYINGVWAGSSPNMPGGEIFDPSLFAFNQGDEDLPHAVLNVNFAAFGIPLFAGQNVLAVEVHNDNTTSSDIGLDASLALSETLAGVLTNDDLANAVGQVTVQFNSFAFDDVSGALAGTVQSSDNSGNFTYTPAANYSGRARIEYLISDATSTSFGVGTVDVAPRNDPPVSVADAYTVDTLRPLVVSVRGEPLIEAGDTRWYYSDTGVDEDTANPAWKLGPDAGFDPAAAGWKGPAFSQLGFGDGDERTSINNAGPGFGVLTYYFYTRFDAPSLPRQIVLDLKRDDGAAVYINGVEVVIDNLPVPHPFNVGALSTDDDDGQMFHRTVLDTANLDLRESDNTIAVEVHQVDAFSSDVSFDLRLFDPTVGLLGNDEDIDDSPSALRAILLSNPIDPLTQGTLALNADGTFTFTPANPQVAGSASFSYRTQDAAGAVSAAATVTLSFVSTDSGPVVAADDLGVVQFAATEDTPLVIDAASGPVGTIGVGVLANDTHPDDETDPVMLAVVAQPASGGSVVFDPANNGGFTYTPGENFHGTDTFTYQVNDGAALSNVATVEITVLSVDDPPVAVPDLYAVPPDTTLVIGFGTGLLANDTDAEGDDLETATLVPGTEPQYGTLNLAADGSFTYLPNAGFLGEDTFMYTVQANGLTSTPALVTIDVVGASTPSTDLDGDGRVTLADVAMFVRDFGALDATAAPADFDGDRRVGIRDLILLRSTLELDNPAAPAVARSSIVDSGAAAERLLSGQRLRAVARREPATPARMQAFAELFPATTLRASRTA